MNTKGFTLIEMMICVAIAGILLALLFSQSEKQPDGTDCVAGYKFVQGKQLIGSNGGGVPCSTSTVSGGNNR